MGLMRIDGAQAGKAQNGDSVEVVATRGYYDDGKASNMVVDVERPNGERDNLTIDGHAVYVGSQGKPLSVEQLQKSGINLDEIRRIGEDVTKKGVTLKNEDFTMLDVAVQAANFASKEEVDHPQK